jgi:glucosamine-6-phosphate deaminase
VSALVEQFTVESLQVAVYPSEDEMGAAAASLAADVLRQAVKHNGSGRVVLATGNSQFAFVEGLRREGEVPWESITAFHMDEYVGIDADHPASFRRWMRERVEGPLGVQMNYIEGDAADPQAECDRYEELLRAAPIDLVCMGIGENGHLAFNEPGDADFDDHRWTKVITLQSQSIAQQVGEGHFPDASAVPNQAISLTIPALLSARNVIVCVPEQRKAQAVAAALTEPISNACPATILRRSGGTLFLEPESFATVKKIRSGGQI